MPRGEKLKLQNFPTPEDCDGDDEYEDGNDTDYDDPEDDEDNDDDDDDDDGDDDGGGDDDDDDHRHHQHHHDTFELHHICCGCL